jgi:transcriptional regulator with XRE-family HTH domain
MSVTTTIRHDLIEQERRKRGWTLKQLAAASNITVNRAVAACYGRPVSVRVVKACCDVLGLDHDDVVIVEITHA